MTPEQLAEAIKTDIRELVAVGRVPSTVGSFAELHDYTDANTLGGTEDLWDKAQEAAFKGFGDRQQRELCEAMTAAQATVDAWIKGGGLKAALVTA